MHDGNVEFRREVGAAPDAPQLRLEIGPAGTAREEQRVVEFDDVRRRQVVAVGRDRHGAPEGDVRGPLPAAVDHQHGPRVAVGLDDELRARRIGVLENERALRDRVLDRRFARDRDVGPRLERLRAQGPEDLRRFGSVAREASAERRDSRG
jgi:hypothetical protein